jgi:cytidyltransferase-like protein
VFNWKKKTGIYIGRFQPFHDGHKHLFENVLKKNTQVAILVMNSHNINKKNPLEFSIVKKNIIRSLKEHKGKFIVIKIPVVSEVVYGRKVGYKIRKVKLSKKIENISATKIRKTRNFKKTK